MLVAVHNVNSLVSKGQPDLSQLYRISTRRIIVFETPCYGLLAYSGYFTISQFPDTV